MVENVKTKMMVVKEPERLGKLRKKSKVSGVKKEMHSKGLNSNL